MVLTGNKYLRNYSSVRTLKISGELQITGNNTRIIPLFRATSLRVAA